MDELTRLKVRLARWTHTEHTKDTVCLTCLNIRLAANAGWTYKPGERAIKVGRYVRGKSGQGHFVQRYGMR